MSRSQRSRRRNTGRSWRPAVAPVTTTSTTAAAEKLSLSFLKGFESDGYCTEGLGYWNFGFSNYLALAEALWQTTDGKVDLFDRPKVKNIALFGSRIEIDGGVYPAFADCVASSTPLSWISLQPTMCPN